MYINLIQYTELSFLFTGHNRKKNVNLINAGSSRNREINETEDCSSLFLGCFATYVASLFYTAASARNSSVANNV